MRVGSTARPSLPLPTQAKRKRGSSPPARTARCLSGRSPRRKPALPSKAIPAPSMSPASRPTASSSPRRVTTSGCCSGDRRMSKPFDYEIYRTDREPAPPVFEALEGHTEGVSCLQFSPNGKLLASGGNDNTVCVWDVEKRKLLKTLRGHAGRVRSVAFAPQLPDVEAQLLERQPRPVGQSLEPERLRRVSRLRRAGLRRAPGRNSRRSLLARQQVAGQRQSRPHGEDLELDVRRQQRPAAGARIPGHRGRLLPQREEIPHRRRRRHDPHLGCGNGHEHRHPPRDRLQRRRRALRR